METIKMQKQLLTKIKSGATVNELQEYFKEVFELRGFSNQTAKDKMLLLIEEVGELAKALRKEDHSLMIDRTRIGNYEAIENGVIRLSVYL